MTSLSKPQEERRQLGRPSPLTEKLAVLGVNEHLFVGARDEDEKQRIWWVLRNSVQHLRRRLGHVFTVSKRPRDVDGQLIRGVTVKRTK